MQYTELRQFIKDANTAKLTPCEKDVFLYYYSRTQNVSGFWYCDDASTAEEINRSRNAVCEARNALRDKHEWITENGQFNISVVKKFSVAVPTDAPEPVEIPTQDDDSQSEIRLEEEISVGTATETPEISVGNPTLIYDKGNSFLEKRKDTKEEKESAQDAHAPEAILRFPFLLEFSNTEIHKHFFPNYNLSLKDSQTIKNRVRDKRAWICALFFWDENNYRAESIGKQCDKHDELIREEKKKQNGIKNSTGQFKSTADQRLEHITATDQRIAELIAEGIAESENLQGEHYGTLEAYSPPC